MWSLDLSALSTLFSQIRASRPMFSVAPTQWWLQPELQAEQPPAHSTLPLAFARQLKFNLLQTKPLPSVLLQQRFPSQELAPPNVHSYSTQSPAGSLQIRPESSFPSPPLVQPTVTRPQQAFRGLAGLHSCRTVCPHTAT